MVECSGTRTHDQLATRAGWHRLADKVIGKACDCSPTSSWLDDVLMTLLTRLTSLCVSSTRLRCLAQLFPPLAELMQRVRLARLQQAASVAGRQRLDWLALCQLTQQALGHRSVV